MNTPKLQTFLTQTKLISKNDPIGFIDRIKESFIENYPDADEAELLKHGIHFFEHAKQLFAKNQDSDF